MRGAKFKHVALEESKLEANDAELKAARDYKRDHYREYRDDEILTEANQHETKADKRRDEEQLHDTPEATNEQQEKRKRKMYQQQSAERKKYAKDQAAEQANADAAARPCVLGMQSSAMMPARSRERPRPTRCRNKARYAPAVPPVTTHSGRATADGLHSLLPHVRASAPLAVPPASRVARPPPRRRARCRSRVACAP